MNIKQIDSIAAKLFPAFYQPQFPQVATAAEIAQLEKISDKDRALYALAGRYSPEAARAAHASGLEQLGTATDAKTIAARETFPSLEEFEAKNGELAKHYLDACRDLFVAEVAPLVEKISARTAAAVDAFEVALVAWEDELGAASGVQVPLRHAFSQILKDIRLPLAHNLERVRSKGIGAASVGEFADSFLGLKFRPLEEFIADAAK